LSFPNFGQSAFDDSFDFQLDDVTFTSSLFPTTGSGTGGSSGGSGGGSDAGVPVPGGPAGPPAPPPPF
jgi:hypothetical protein